MTKPLALVFYERLLPGSQLVNRLTDIGYRVQGVTDLGTLTATVKKEKPLILLTDLHSAHGSVAQVIAELKGGEDTKHVPILGFTARKEERLHPEAVQAGADLVAFDEAILPQLPQMLEQLLMIE